MLDDRVVVPPAANWVQMTGSTEDTRRAQMETPPEGG